MTASRWLWGRAHLARESPCRQRGDRRSPISIDPPFQDWTRSSAELRATVFVYIDYAVPVAALRSELTRVLERSSKWDGKVNVLQVTDARERTLDRLAHDLIALDDERSSPPQYSALRDDSLAEHAFIVNQAGRFSLFDDVPDASIGGSDRPVMPNDLAARLDAIAVLQFAIPTKDRAFERDHAVLVHAQRETIEDIRGPGVRRRPQCGAADSYHQDRGDGRRPAKLSSRPTARRCGL